MTCHTPHIWVVLLIGRAAWEMYTDQSFLGRQWASGGVETCGLFPQAIHLIPSSYIYLFFLFFFAIRNKWQSGDRWPKWYESLMEDFFTGFQGRYVIEVTGVFKVLGYESIILQSNFNLTSIDPIFWIVRHTTYPKKSAWLSGCGVQALDFNAVGLGSILHCCD